MKKNNRALNRRTLLSADTKIHWEKIFRDLNTPSAEDKRRLSHTDRSNLTTTENGATGYKRYTHSAATSTSTKSTSKPHSEPYNCPYAKFPVHTTPEHDPISDSAKEAIVNFAFKVTSMRGFTDEQILDEWSTVLDSGLPIETIVRYIFYVRNPRGGLGERRLGRLMLRGLADRNPKVFKKILPLIIEYGRWDDLWMSVFVPKTIPTKNLSQARSFVLSYIEDQLLQDVENITADQASISLLAKWLPSINSHNKETAERAAYFATKLNWTPRTYRKTLSKLRSVLNVIEQKMSAKRWTDIEYSKVPSLAALRYRRAFSIHDNERYSEYLTKLNKGETKVNASVTSPVDIVSAYSLDFSLASYSSSKVPSELLENAWKTIPTPVLTNTIVVRDGSGSMLSRIPGSNNRTALDVSTALAIFFAEHLNGPFKNRFITFSSRPKLVDLTDCETLFDKLRETYRHTDCANTNIEATFDLILKIAVENKLSQDEIPDVLIISDMEFDRVANTAATTTLFDAIAAKYAEHGYKLPRLIFNNVCSRSLTIPMIKNDNGLVLVSGFNQNILKMVTSGCLDPFEAIMDAINDEIYSIVDIFLYDLMSPGDYDSDEEFEHRFDLNVVTNNVTNDSKSDSRASSRPRDSWGRDTKF